LQYKFVKRFGERIRQLRLQKKLTQERLAERAGLHLTFISLVERGRFNASLKSINKLSKGLKVPVWEIFLGMERARDLPKTEHLKLKGLVRKGMGRPVLVDEKGRRLRPIRKSGKKSSKATGKARRKP
jgi:transcriptional regulator with XRE-family HTH domain